MKERGGRRGGYVGGVIVVVIRRGNKGEMSWILKAKEAGRRGEGGRGRRGAGGLNRRG